MRKQNMVRKYFKDNPEVLEALKADIHQYGDNIIRDEDIPDFDAFLARNSAVKTLFEESGRRPDKQPKERRFNRMILIPVTVLLMLILFFGFTPTGHAFAEAIFKTVIQWFGGGVTINYGPGDANDLPSAAPVDENGLNDNEHYNSIDEMRIGLNKSIAELDGHIPVDIVFSRSYDYTTIRTRYILEETEIVITQDMSQGIAGGVTDIDFEEGQPVDVLADDVRFIGYVKEDYGYAIAYMDDTTIDIYAAPTDHAGFIALLEKIIIE